MNAPHAPLALTPEPVQAAVRHLAYHFYLLGGCRPGHDLDNWVRAERVLKRITHRPLHRLVAGRLSSRRPRKLTVPACV